MGNCSLVSCQGKGGGKKLCFTKTLAEPVLFSITLRYREKERTPPVLAFHALLPESAGFEHLILSADDIFSLPLRTGGASEARDRGAYVKYTEDRWNETK